MSSTTHSPAPAAQPTVGTWPVVSWALWDWGSAAFNAVITTFVFTVYLKGENDDGTPFFGEGVDTKLGWTLAAAGLLIAVLAPLTGQRADRAGRRGLWLTVNTAAVAAVSGLLFFVKPEEQYLWLGLLLLAAGNVFFEFASVHYNALLSRVSTPGNVGRVSGFGWGLGYLGGIVLLLVLFFGFISPDVGLFGVTSDEGLNVRVSMLLCAVWTVVFSLPVILTLRDRPSPTEKASARVSVAASYRALFATVRGLWRTDRNLVKFLLASAVFRDGLAGVFTFGAVLAAGSFGFSDGGVIIFGIAANVVAGIATIAFGVLDDRLGARRVIVGALSAMLVAAVAIFVLHDGGSTIFWIFGLTLCIFVGPIQSASRTYLQRLVPAGREGEMFGLYATTGRAVSFLAPAMWSISITVGAAILGSSHDDAQHFGILGIMLVLALGLVLLLQVRNATADETA